MKKIQWIIFSGVLVTFFLGLHACTVTPPFSSTAISGTVLINDQATGACPVRAWLDGVGPVTVSGGSIHTFSNIAPGSHNLTFSTTATTSCGAGAVTCVFNQCCSGNVAGYSVSFNLLSHQTQTVGITDNGCNQLYVSNPVWEP